MSVEASRRKPEGPTVCVTATNPQHMLDVATQLRRHGLLKRFICGYPAYKLPPEIRPYSATGYYRTLLTYAMLKIPHRFRPSNHRLYAWQDEGFDRWASKVLPRCDVVQGMCGQSLHTFDAAEATGTLRVLNAQNCAARIHNQKICAEYARYGMDLRTSHVYFPPQRIKHEELEMERMDAMLCSSSFQARTFVEQGAQPEDIQVIPYGVDLSLFSPRFKRDGVFRVVYAGQVTLGKGFAVLLRALERLPLRAAECLVCGTVSPETPALLSSYRGQVAVELAGHVPRSRLAEYLSQGSVFVMPSFCDAFGMVVLQAMACGLPVIVSDHTGAADVVRGGMNGFVFPAGNDRRLADRILQLAEDASLRARLASAARDNALRSGGWDDYGDLMAAFLRNRVEKHGGDRR